MKKLSWVLGLFFMVTVGVPALGQSEKPTLTGVVTVKGNDPFTYLALTEKDGTGWKLTGPLVGDLERHQNARVRVEVKSLPHRLGHSLVPPEAEVTGFRVLEEVPGPGDGSPPVSRSLP